MPKVDTIHRTGTAASPTRYIVTIRGKGRDKEEKQLSTPITKIGWKPEFRHGLRRTPVEQYAFKVGKQTVERFADATALVMRKHQVELEDPTEGHQGYVKQALKMIAGQEKIHFLKDLPDDAAPVTRN